MELKNQVVSLELAKRLKELGVKQDSLFYWRLGYHTSEKFDDKGVSLGKVGHFDHNFALEYYPRPRYSTADVKWNQADLQKLDQTELSAFTVAELGEMLPLSAQVGSGSSKATGGWNANYYHSDSSKSYSCGADTEADARAYLLIYLIENRLITL